MSCSGKTPPLQLLGALDRPSQGSILPVGCGLGTLGDNELAELRRKAFGFVLQQSNHIPTLTPIVAPHDAQLPPRAPRRHLLRDVRLARAAAVVV